MLRIWYFFRRWGTVIAGWFRSRNKFVRVLAWILVIALALAITIPLIAWALPRVPRWFWQLAAIAVALAFVVWWFVRGMPYLERRSFLSRRHGDLAPGKSEDEAEPVAQMSALLKAAKTTILRSPEWEKGLDPLYRIPWVLFLGDAAANVNGLLAAGVHTSPFPLPDGSQEPARFWRWWFYKRMVAIEMSPAFVCDNADTRARGIWYRALELLYHERRKLPVNGIVALCSAQALLGDEAALRAYGLKLRRLMDEAMEQLQIEAPIYLVVTGLDTMPGYAATVSRFPGGVRPMVIGERVEWQALPEEAVTARIASVLRGLRLRWHAIRLGALPLEYDHPRKRGIYAFCEAFATIENRAELLLRTLTESNPFQRNPRWRGIYFTATGADGAAFTDDLFIRFLPTDQPLAARARHWHFGRWIRAAIGIGCVAGLSSYFAYSVWQGIRGDEELKRQVTTACKKEGPAGETPVGQLIRCRRDLEAIDAVVAQMPLRFGIDAADSEVEAMKRKLLADFDSLVMSKYSPRLTREIQATVMTFEHHLAARQRAFLVNRCIFSSVCRIFDEEPDFVFDPGTTFVRAIPDIATGIEKRALIESYVAYLRWSRELDRERLNRESREVTPQVASVRARPVTPKDVVAWAEPRYPPVTLASYWRPDPPPTGPPASPYVSAAYTRTVEQNVITHFLAWDQTAQLIVPSIKQAGDGISRGYYEQYLKAWALFLKDFHFGAEIWKGQLETLLERCARGECPHKALAADLGPQLFELPLKHDWRNAQRQLFERTRADWSTVFSNTWDFCATMWRTIWQKTSVTFPSWVSALETGVKGTWPDAEPLLLRLLNGAINDRDGKESYQLAAEIYSTKGTSVNGAARDFADLLGKVDKPSEAFAARMDPEGAAAWGVTRTPARIALLLITHRAGRQIQALWDDKVRGQLAGLTDQQKTERLLGIGGQTSLFNTFVSEHLKGFVSPNDKQPQTLLGVALPVSDGFKSLRTAQVRGDPMIQGTAFDLGTIAFTRPARFASQNEGGAGSSVLVQCKTGGSFNVSSRASAAAGRETIVGFPDKCDKVVLRVAIPDPPPAPPATVTADPPKAGAPPPPPPPPPGMTLEWVYEGPRALRNLATDFASGVRSIRLSEFAKFYSPAQWQEIQRHPGLTGVDRTDVYLQVKLSQQAINFFAGSRELPTVPERLVD